jgi:hypothetical protein
LNATQDGDVHSTVTDGESRDFLQPTRSPYTAVCKTEKWSLGGTGEWVDSADNPCAIGIHSGYQTDWTVSGDETWSCAAGGDGLVEIVLWARRNWE